MILIVAMATIEFSLIQARLPIKSEGGQLSGQYFNVCHKWQQSDVGMVMIASSALSLKHTIRLTRAAIWQDTYIEVQSS